jgi:hypothetical protein
MNGTITYSCGCFDNYGEESPCEAHSIILAQREGASTRTSDELALVWIGDACAIIGADALSATGRITVDTAWRMLRDNDSGTGCLWYPDSDDAHPDDPTAEEIRDDIRSLSNELEELLLTLDDGPVLTDWDDGYLMYRISGDSPLRDPAGEIAELTSYRLANMADVASLDSPDSPGSLFLLGIRDDVVDAIRSGRDQEDSEHEIADGAIPVYTHDRMLTLVDLAAYHEDLDELGGSPSDMVEAAAWSLYLVAQRLVSALYSMAGERA